MIAESEQLVAIQCDGWTDFAKQLKLNKKGLPLSKSKQQIRQVMHRLHNKGRCKEVNGTDGEILWLYPVHPNMKGPSKTLPKEVKAYSVGADFVSVDGDIISKEFKVVEDSPNAACAKLRLFALIGGCGNDFNRVEKIKAEPALTIII